MDNIVSSRLSFRWEEVTGTEFQSSISFGIDALQERLMEKYFDLLHTFSYVLRKKSGSCHVVQTFDVLLNIVADKKNGFAGEMVFTREGATIVNHSV